MTLQSLLMDWLALHSLEIRPRTREQYQHLITQYIAPYPIASTVVDTLSANDVRRYLASIVATGHTRTAELCYSMLSCALRDYDITVMAAVRRPRHTQSHPTPWSDAEMAVYLAACDDHPHGLALSLGLLLGLRRGEICGLRWHDIDWSAGIANICNQRIRLDTGEIIDAPPKSVSSVRSIPIPPPLLARLRAARQLSGYIDPITPSGLDHAHARLVSNLSLRPIPLHGLRHSMATAMIRHGADIRTVQSILGHHSYAVTASIYTHPDTAMLCNALSLVTRICYTYPQREHLTLNQGVQGSSP